MMSNDFSNKHYFAGISLASGASIDTGAAVLDRDLKVITLDKLFTMEDVKFFINNFAGKKNTIFTVSIPENPTMLNAKWKLYSREYQLIQSSSLIDVDKLEWTHRFTPRGSEFFKECKKNGIDIFRYNLGELKNSLGLSGMYKDRSPVECKSLQSAFKYKVSKFMFLGSSCIYPKNAPQPIKEEYLLSSKLEPTNEPYALAKICGIKLANAYNRQYGTNYISVMPCNLYGIGDNYHPENAHVVPMLIRRFHEAKMRGDKTVSAWGTGTPLREFLFSDDLASACVYLMENKNADEIGEFINIGSGKERTIKEIVELVKKTVGFEGEVVWDKTKPDGTPRKLMDVSRINSLGWKAQVELEEGLKIAYKDFLERYSD